jgi:hypothetical protein
VSDTLGACLELLRPGGALIVRTRLCTAATPSASYRRFASPYPQLLAGERDLARLLRARADEPLPYRNWLTATSYVMLMHRAGFEILDAERIHDPEADAVLTERIGHALGGCAAGELAQTLEAHLVRPLTLEDLGRAGAVVDTRPASAREHAALS